MSSVSPASPETPRPIGEIAQGPSAFEQFLDRNQKNLVALTILLALAVAAWVIYRGVANSKEHTAGALLNKAEDLATLRSLVKEHAGTAAAASAQVLLAERQWTEGDKDTAVATLNGFIAANAKHPARASAQASLGSKLLTQGKTAEAKKLFQQIVEDPAARFMAPYALLALGDISKAEGDTAAAEKSYQKAKTEFPDSSFSNIISQRLSLLKAQLPVEIAPPPPPPAPATPATPATPVVPAPAADGAAPVAPAAPSDSAAPVPAKPAKPAKP
ncbi:MAG: tetratricopeptide repeat protein [Verrucomicrobiota bacterium]